MTIKMTNRYDAMGIPVPDPKTVCHGQCEGTGLIPISKVEKDQELKRRWDVQHRKSCNLVGVLRQLWRHPEWWYWKSILCDLIYRRSVCDGWHFVKCPDCEGTGKKEATDAEQ
jgi:hypothetical protein